MTTVAWARLHRLTTGEAEAPDVSGLAVGWHLWQQKNAPFPPVMGPGFRYLISRELPGKVRTTDRLAVVHDFLPWTDVVSLADAYSRGVSYFGPGLGVGVGADEWYGNEYNARRAERGRVLTMWSFTVFEVPPVEIGNFNGTFTGWKQLPSVLEVPNPAKKRVRA